MDLIIKPNWDIFRAKFNDNPQGNFEWFCYLLFCKEYEQEKGVFRYKNQSAIETNTISVGDKIIGWQAKFYDTTLSSNKAKLVETLQAAKKNYKDINKVVFYTNQEWGQGKTNPKENDSKAKKEVEDKAKELGIEIQWNTASFFEAPFVVQNNKEIAEHFFSLEESIIDRINKKIIPRVSELNEQYKQTFRGIQGTFINRAEIDECIKNINQDKSIIIHGKAGLGKSGCTQGIIDYCEAEGVPYIAIKLDDRMPEQNADKWGEELGLTTSIPIALSMICENTKGVIILDQLDALRWTNIHSRQALITCTEIIKRVEEINLNRNKKISIVFVCRTYDYENDPNIKALFSDNSLQNKEKISVEWEEIIVEQLPENIVKKIVGERYDLLSSKMKKVLSIASNLYMWEHLGKESMYDDYSTASQLIQKWWEQIKRKCTDNLVDELEVEAAKEELVNKINTLGKLHINVKLLNRSKVTEKSLTYLISSGFVVQSNNSISFAHQSISDYFLAQEMLNRYFGGEDIIKIIGSKDKQTPQKRYQIQMLLQDIQIIDEEKLILVGIRMMESNEIRFYVKYVFFEVVGQATTVNDATKKFILKYCDDSKYGNHIVDAIILGHPIFVQLLIDNGILDKWMSLVDKKEMAIKLLQSISPHYRSEDTDFIKRHLFKSFEDDKKLGRCFSYNIYDEIDEMFELRLTFYEKYPFFIDSYIDFKKLFIRCEVRALRLFELILKNELKGRRRNLNYESFLNEENEVSIENVNLILDTLLVYIPHDKEVWYSKWSSKGSYNQGIERACVEIIKNANVVLIKTDPKEFINRYQKYFNKGYSVYNEIILDGLMSFPIDLSNIVINCLYENFNSLIFDKSSATKNELDKVKKVIEIYSRFCDKKTYLKLEEKIMHFMDHRAKDWYKERIAFNKDKRNNTKVYWRYWGDLQIILLSVLPKNRISPEAHSMLSVLERSCNSFKEINVYNKIRETHGSVYSPISGKKLSNKQWIQIITNTKLEVENRSSQWIEAKGGFVESSLEEFARELREAVSLEPQRFIKLLVDNGLNINEVYVDALFSGVAYSEKLEEVSNEMLERLIYTYRYNYVGYRARYICDMVSKKKNREWSYKILDILIDIALNHSNPKIDEPNVTSPDDKEMKSFNMLSSNAINCVRGSAASAIGSLLWHDKSLFIHFESVIIQLCQDENPAVRLATLDILFPVYNINRIWAIEKIINILKSDYRLAGYSGMRQMFFHIYPDKPKETEEIILKCFYDEDKDLIRIGSYTLAEMYIRLNIFTEVVNNIENLNQEQVKYMLEMIIEYFSVEEYNELAKNLIIKYITLDMDLEFPIAKIFYDNLIDIERDRDFLKKLLSYRSSKKIVSAFVRYLEKSDQPIIAYKDVIFQMSYNIIEKNIDSEEYIYGLNEAISKLIIGLYDESSQGKNEVMNAIAGECLCIWDLMFEKRIGAARILTSKMLDR